MIRKWNLVANTTERLRINQNGQVEIQERLWVPGNKLISLGNSAASPHFSFYKSDATGVNHITSNSGAEIKCSSGNGDSNGFEFWDYTGNNKRCQIDGHGIKFNTDTAEANALNDYEEGSWTPTVENGSGSFYVYSATYTKIGRQVGIQFYMTLNNGGGNGNGVSIGGLPFPVRSNGWTCSKVSTGYNNSGIHCRAKAGTSSIDIKGPADQTITFSNINNTWILSSFIYFTDS